MNKHQDFERNWWGDCANTYGEETKQRVYASRMGLTALQLDGKFPFYDVGGSSIVDIGGGPASLLLKTINVGYRCVVDPCQYPSWVYARYAECGIHHSQNRAEDFRFVNERFDEAWLYNVLQHVDDPELIISKARQAVKVIRIFEWIDIPPHPGHPHELKATTLDQWLGGTGRREQLNNEGGCVGRAYYGVFR